MKNWKVKTQGTFCMNKTEKFNTKDEAMKWIEENLPRSGIYSQAVHHKLFERIGLFKWKLIGCYIRDTKYTTNENGEDEAEPLENVVMACEHMKQYLGNMEKEGNKKCNSMFYIRANFIRIFCKKNCDNNAFMKQ